MRTLAFASLVSLMAPLAAQNDATLGVLHGIPGLPAPVTVAVDGVDQFSFDFPQFVGDISLPAATYLVEVKLNGAVVLSENLTLNAGENYTAVAHLTPATATAPQDIALSAFVNDTTAPGFGQNTVTARHLAAAPAVDVVAKRLFFGQPATLFANVSNGQEGTAVVRSGFYRLSLEAAGTGQTAFGPETLFLRSNRNQVVYAIGELGTPSFQLFVQDVPVSKALPTLTGSVQGTTCGGTIGLSTTNPSFDTPFQVTLTGGVADAKGLFHTGFSDSRLLLFKQLPVDLSSLGFTGCTLYQSTEIIRPIQLDAAGKGSYDVTIPATAARFFQELHFQWSYLDTAAPRDYVLSDYASVVR